jgi:hypothetical protein
MTIYDKGCISNYRNCSLCCFSNVLYRMLTVNQDANDKISDSPDLIVLTTVLNCVIADRSCFSSLLFK